MVFRRENKADAFQRQISALRQQLGPDGEETSDAEVASRDDFDRDRDSEGDSTFTRVERRRESVPLTTATERGPDNDNVFGASPDPAAYTGAPASFEGNLDHSPPLPAIPTADSHASVIAHDAFWSGDLRSDGSIHVHGKVEGTITSRQDVFVAEEAIVDATITAVNIIVAGRVKGLIRCQGRFEALPQGRITADVQAPALVVHEGASITGGFRMGVEATAEASSPVTPPGQPAPVVHRRSARGGA